MTLEMKFCVHIYSIQVQSGYQLINGWGRVSGKNLQNGNKIMTQLKLLGLGNRKLPFHKNAHLQPSYDMD